MSNDFSPIQLKKPTIRKRKAENSRYFELAPEVVAQRAQIATRLLDQLNPLNEQLKKLSDQQRKAIFYKIETNGNIDFSGTDLKVLGEAGPGIALVMPRKADLSKLTSRLIEFRDAQPVKNQLPHSSLAVNIKEFILGKPTDRLCEDFFEQYAELTKRDFLVYEVEILTEKTGKKQRKDDLARIRLEISNALLGDQYAQIFEHEDVNEVCRFVIRTSGSSFKKLVEDSKWQRTILYFDSRPQFQTFIQTLNEFKYGELGEIGEPDEDAPIVCIVDSGLSDGNPFLAAALRPDLARSFLTSDPEDWSDETGHGSAVGSLAAYYAINFAPGAVNSPKTWLAGARILDGTNSTEPGDDPDADEGQLFSSLLERVVKSFVEDGIKIFNLSVNDTGKRWNEEAKRTVPRSSWVARKIDYLSRKYDIIFVVSTGNVSRDDVRSTVGTKDYPVYFKEESCKLLDPAHACLALTVGSLAHSATVANAPSDSALADKDQPSPFSRCGPGINREIKPEVVEYGGNYVLKSGTGVGTNVGTDVVVASNVPSPVLSNQSGTSFAAPRVSFALAQVQRELNEREINPSSCLLKALVVNSASIPTEALKLSDELDARELNHLVGYGKPDYLRATTADKHSVILIYDGIIRSDRMAFFNFHVPKELGNQGVGKKRLSVTLCFYPEVQKWGFGKYFGTTLKWRMFRGNINKKKVEETFSVELDEEAGKRGNLDEEIPFEPSITLRSRGATQHACHEWTQHPAEFSESQYTLAVAAHERWQRNTDGSRPPEMQFAVVVRLEDLSRECEVNSLVRAQIEVEAEITDSYR